MAKSRKTEESPADPSVDAPRIERVAIADLIPDPANVRKRTDRNRATIKNSLKRFGAGRSILVDRDNVIVAGNGVAEQSAEAGISEVLIVEARPDQLVAVKRSDLTKTEATALAIADNRAAELAEWDFEPLGKQMQALQLDGLDLAEIGWEPHEVEPLLAADWSPPTPGEMPGQSEDDDDGETPAIHPHTVCFSPEAYAIVEQAADRVRAIEEDDSIPIQRCIELICADWLNDPNWHASDA